MAVTVAPAATRTGQEAEPVVVDARTGERVDGPDHVFTAGPAAGPVMRQRYEGAARRPVPVSAAGPS